MHVTCANHKVGSLPTSSCIFFYNIDAIVQAVESQTTTQVKMPAQNRVSAKNRTEKATAAKRAKVSVPVSPSHASTVGKVKF